MLEEMLTRWRGLGRREQRMVFGAALVIGLAVLYLFAFEPAWLGRQTVGKELVAARSEAAQLDALAGEARRLSGSTAPIASPQSIRATLEKSIEFAGLKTGLAQISVSGDLIDVRFKSVPFTQVLVWLDAALRETRVRVVDANVSREAGGGMVSMRLALEAPKTDAR